MLIWFHPQRGAVMTKEPFDRRCRRYRGGADDSWRIVREPLPEGFLFGDPSRQQFGLGGPEHVFGPLEKSCRACGRDFIFTAIEQKRWTETYRMHIDVTAVRCGPCRRAYRRLQQCRRRYEDALRTVKSAPSARAHAAVATAALALLAAGGHAPRDQVTAHARKAGAASQALLHTLKKRRQS